MVWKVKVAFFTLPPSTPLTNTEEFILHTTTFFGEIQMANKFGTPYADTIYSNDLPDLENYVDTDTGNDKVFGGLGNDTIIAGPDYPNPLYSDNDLVLGDRQAGEASHDDIFGGYGDDTLYGDSMLSSSGVGGNDDIYGGSGNDSLIGGGGNDYLVGGTGNDTLLGEDGNDNLEGESGADSLVGGNGNDTLNGSDFYGDGIPAADTLIGGVGNDEYIVESSLDNVIEYAGEGIDTVVSTISYTLGANLENLTLTGSVASNGTGNNLNNIIKGDSAISYNLYGGAGNDTLSGNDLNDNLDGGDGNDNLDGGFYGDDYLNGRSGADTMVGRLGNDKYVVDNVGDVVVENAAEGTDTVVSTIDYTLGANVENLTLTDSAVNGTGNSLDNYILGNAVGNFIFAESGNDLVNGRSGDDYIHGGAGNDTLHGDTGNDYLYGSTGNDLFYGGDGNDTLLGDAGNDFFYGNAGNDILIGGSGNDTLYGGANADRFRFDFQSDGIDIIKDFNRTEGDKIEIFNLSFGATSLNQFSYNSTTGALFFGSTQLAILENKPAGFSVQTDLLLV